jgi:hypothetical protein
VCLAYSSACGWKGDYPGFLSAVVFLRVDLVVSNIRSVLNSGTSLLRLGRSLPLPTRFRGSNLLQSGDCLVDATTLVLKSGQNAFKVHSCPPSLRWQGFNTSFCPFPPRRFKFVTFSEQIWIQECNPKSFSQIRRSRSPSKQRGVPAIFRESCEVEELNIAGRLPGLNAFRRTGTRTISRHTRVEDPIADTQACAYAEPN